MVDVKTCMEIGKLAREIRSNARSIERYKKEIDNYYAKLIVLMPEGSNKPTLEEIVEMKSDIY